MLCFCALLATSPAVAQPVATAPAADRRVLSLPGVIAPDERVELYAKASGYVSRITVDIGSRVKRGDVLVELDIPEMHDELSQAEALLAARTAKVQALQARAEQARLMIQSAEAEEKRYTAEHELARITFDRKSELFQGNAIPAQEFDVAKNALTLAEAQRAIGRAKVAAARGELLAAQADVKAGEADVAVANADVARVKTLLGYTRITAPFDGVVTSRKVDHGAFVRSAALGTGAPLLTIDKIDRVRLIVDIPEMEAPFIKPGAAAQASVRALGEGMTDVKITRLSGAIRSESRTMRAEIDIDNRQARLLPGMYAHVAIPISGTTSTRPGA